MKRAPEPPVDPNWLPGFERFFHEEIEPKVRIPKRNRRADARAIWLTWAALAATLVTALMWALEVNSSFVGLAVVLSGALIVGALQLRMAGTSMGARETRDFVVAKMAAFLNLDYELAPSRETVDETMGTAGRMSHTDITRGADLIHGRVGECEITSLQLLGGAGPSATAEGEQVALWLGMPVTQFWDQYTVDGVLARVKFREALPLDFTVTCDQRLITPPEQAGSLQFAATKTDDAAFDAEFFAFAHYDPRLTGSLNSVLRAFLLRVKNTVGPCTLFAQGDQLFLSAWFVGDVYEISSMGFALPRQSHQIALSMRMAHELAWAAQGLEPPDD